MYLDFYKEQYKKSFNNCALSFARLTLAFNVGCAKSATQSQYRESNEQSVQAVDITDMGDFDLIDLVNDTPIHLININTIALHQVPTIISTQCDKIIDAINSAILAIQEPTHDTPPDIPDLCVRLRQHINREEQHIQTFKNNLALLQHHLNAGVYDRFSQGFNSVDRAIAHARTYIQMLESDTYHDIYAVEVEDRGFDDMHFFWVRQ